MDGDQSKNDHINQQLVQEALSIEFNQQQQKQEQQQQGQQQHIQEQNNYDPFFSNDAHGITENATNFETLAPFQNFISDPSVYLQPPSTSTMNPSLEQQRVENIAPNPLENESEYIYQQYLHMMSNNSHSTLDFDFQDFLPPPATPVRQEQDVFNELLSMALKRNQQGGSWPSSPALMSSLETSILITQQQQNSFVSPSDNVNSTPLLLQENSTKNGIAIAPGFIHPSSNNDREYKLDIVQQPSRARMCGFGDKDRRPISPPPILRLTVLDKNGQVVNPETFDISFLVTMCDACQQSVATAEVKRNDSLSLSSSTLVENTMVFSKRLEKFPTQTVSFTNDVTQEQQHTAVKMRNLVGASVASAKKLYDLDGNLGIFFIFQDISLRTEGLFRLLFTLTDIGSPQSHRVNTTTVSKVLALVETDSFMVYTAKKYPGVVHSTPLSTCFALQGIKIPIRKNPRESSLATVDLSGDDTEQDDS